MILGLGTKNFTQREKQIDRYIGRDTDDIHTEFDDIDIDIDDRDDRNKERYRQIDRQRYD